MIFIVHLQLPDRTGSSLV